MLPSKLLSYIYILLILIFYSLKNYYLFNSFTLISNFNSIFVKSKIDIFVYALNKLHKFGGMLPKVCNIFSISFRLKNLKCSMFSFT